ncbi:MAG TPA: transaldolase family protein [Ktedonobacteraceae bacterium]|nr:transaldolase family protein [Ktedonobacteraceae bacterium]
MALYIDCAYLDDITNVTRSIPTAGVTTNPTIMLAAYERGQRLEPQRLLNELLDKQAGAVFIQPGAITEEAMYNEALAYLETSPDRVIPKLPMTLAGMQVALRLKFQGYPVAFTAVTTVAQAYMAAMAKADFIIPYYNRLERSGVDASERLSQMAELLHNQQVATRILAASIKSPIEAAQALMAGAHDLTMPPQVLLDMVTDPQSEQAVENFAQDWHKMKKL